MGELLRGVLEKNCLKSRPAWYASEKTYGPLTVGAQPTLTGAVRIRKQTHFLLMGFNYQIVNFDPAGNIFQPVFLGAQVGFSLPGPNTVQLSQLDTSDQFYQCSPFGTSTIAQNVVSNTNQPITFDEYRYFEPNHRLGYTFTDASSTFGGTRVSTLTMVFFGIEYLMKGDANGQAS